MSSQELNSLSEIQPELADSQTSKRISAFAKFSFYSGLLLLFAAIVSSLLMEFEYELRKMEQLVDLLNCIFGFFVIFGSPLLILMGIVALVRILLSKNKLDGHKFAILGILLPIASFIILAFFAFINMDPW